LKEFKRIIWGQRIKVFTEHKNLMQNALGMISDSVYRWRLLLEEFGPEIEYIKGVDNTVADAISRLEYDPDKKTSCLELHQCRREGLVCRPRYTSLVQQQPPFYFIQLLLE